MENSKFKQVAAVIRTYNNNPDSRKAVERALKNGVGLVVVVVNAHDKTTRGNVKAWCKSLAKTYPKQLEIIEMTRGYGWSNALNLGIARVQEFNLRTQLLGRSTIDYVFNLSVETLWEAPHLEKMLGATETEGARIVGTSFLGLSHGKQFPLGNRHGNPLRLYSMTYEQPRNTCMIIHRSVFSEIGQFDAMCDELGGMEDFHFLVQAYLAGIVVARLDIDVPLIIGKNHDQLNKLKRERKAVWDIHMHFRRMVEGDPDAESEMNRALDNFRIVGDDGFETYEAQFRKYGCYTGPNSSEA